MYLWMGDPGKGRMEKRRESSASFDCAYALRVIFYAWRVDGYDWVERKVSGLSSDWRGLNQDEITMSIGGP